MKISEVNEHPCVDVSAAIIRLNDALCMWERSTGRQSVLIIREEGGWSSRSCCGKPGIPDDVTDEMLLGTLDCGMLDRRRNRKGQWA